MPYAKQKDGSILTYAKYCRLGSATLTDIFPNEKEITKLLTLYNNESFRKYYSRRNKAAVIRKIFFDFIQLVINSLMEGGMMAIPTKSKASIAIKKLSPAAVTRYIELNYISAADARAANYELPVLKYDFGPNSKKTDRYIFLPKYFANILMKNAASRKIKYTYYIKK